MDLNKYISKSFDNRRTSHDRSTVFDATLEQAELSFSKARPKLPPMSLTRKPISQRSSNTFESEVFKPPKLQTQKFKPSHPQDHSSKDFYAVDNSEFQKKSLVSDFKPDFKPNFTYRPVWEISHPGFESKNKNKEQIEEKYLIRPVGKRGNKSDSRRERLNNRLDRFGRDDDDLRDDVKYGFDKTSSFNRLEENKRLERFERLEELGRNSKLEQSQIIERNEGLDRSAIFDRNEARDNLSEASNTKTLSQTSRTPIKPAKDSSVRAIYRDRPASASSKTDCSSTPTSEPSHLLQHKPPVPNPPLSQNSNPNPNRSYSSSSPICLHLSGLSTSTSEFSIRELCKNVQIIEFKSFRNHITGTSSSTASITIKANQASLASVQSSLEKQGLKIEVSSISLGKKNNYSELAHVDFLDQFVNKDSSKTPVKHHLESSQDVFGSSPGVGRFHSGKKVRDMQAVVLQTWNFVKGSRKEERVNENLNSLPSYMRSTQSSVRKCKKLN